MPHTVDAAFQDELRRAGLSGRGVLPHLLALLRESPETHLSLSDIAGLSAEAGLAITANDLAQHPEGVDVIMRFRRLGSPPHDS
jgi:Fur family iron response transcriptional regulator